MIKHHMLSRSKGVEFLEHGHTIAFQPISGLVC